MNYLRFTLAEKGGEFRECCAADAWAESMACRRDSRDLAPVRMTRLLHGDVERYGTWLDSLIAAVNCEPGVL